MQNFFETQGSLSVKYCYRMGKRTKTIVKYIEANLPRTIFTW